ncbi:MAG: cytochrome c [Bdellovibrionales bacterium]|jgi:mono/diheme cytochrome c family protein|nr:cytochrome c [Bdellovibrionales bacterium]
MVQKMSIKGVMKDMSLKATRNKKEKFVTLSLALIVLVGGAVGCTKSTEPKLSKKPNVELIQDMMDSPALKAQDFEPSNPTKGSARIPPEGTVPVGYTPYKYAGDPIAAAANLKNPLAGNSSVEVIELGRRKYEIYCALCHGYTGAGDGPVAPKMALKPPPIAGATGDKVVKMSDAAIYHIVTDGQGVMASYAYQMVKEEDRWAVVNYVRNLQKLAKTEDAGKASN